jgi:hypothetical protein
LVRLWLYERFKGDDEPTMTEKAETYFSYLLRLWRDESDHAFVWRASLESAQTGERYHFSVLDELIAFLHEQTRESTDFYTNSE